MDIIERKCSICGKNKECIKFVGRVSIPEKSIPGSDINILTKTFDVYICKECHKKIKDSVSYDCYCKEEDIG